MKYSAADWAELRKSGIAGYLMVDGILLTCGPFSVGMQVIGVFSCGMRGKTFRQYFSRDSVL